MSENKNFNNSLTKLEGELDGFKYIIKDTYKKIRSCNNTRDQDLLNTNLYLLLIFIFLNLFLAIKCFLRLMKYIKKATI